MPFPGLRINRKLNSSESCWHHVLWNTIRKCERNPLKDMNEGCGHSRTEIPHTPWLCSRVVMASKWTGQRECRVPYRKSSLCKALWWVFSANLRILMCSRNGLWQFRKDHGKSNFSPATIKCNCLLSCLIKHPSALKTITNRKKTFAF